MTLIVEDGTGKADAQAYASATDVRAFATARGRTVPAADPDLEPLILRAMDWLDAQPFKGGRGTAAQALEWPRTGVVADGFDVPATGAGSLPAALVKALSLLVIELASGTELAPAQTSPTVLEEAVGPIRTRYSDRLGAIDGPLFPAVEMALRPIVKTGFTLNLVRA